MMCFEFILCISMLWREYSQDVDCRFAKDRRKFMFATRYFNQTIHFRPQYMHFLVLWAPESGGYYEDNRGYRCDHNTGVIVKEGSSKEDPIGSYTNALTYRAEGNSSGGRAAIPEEEEVQLFRRRMKHFFRGKCSSCGLTWFG